MSKNMGYSICYRGDTFTAVGVSRTDKKRWRVDTLETGAAAMGPSASLADAMAAKGATLAYVAPGKDARNALTAMPSLKKKEMTLAVAGWVAREEGTPTQDWRVAWTERHREQPDPERKDVFLLYGGVEQIEAARARVAKWGGEPTLLLPDYMILETMYRLYGPEREDLAGWNLVFVGKNEQFLCVSTPEGMILTRELPADLSETGDSAEHVDRLATEVDRSLFFARQTEFNPRIDQVVVCGDQELATALVERLGEETSVPAVHWDLSEVFEVADGELNSDQIIPVMAAALSGNPHELNLLPRKARRLMTPLVRRRLQLVAATVALVVVPLLTVGGMMTTGIQDNYLKQAEGRLQEAMIRADQARAVYVARKVLETREGHIAEAERFQRDYAGVLLHLAELTPEEIVYKDLRLREEAGGGLHLFLTGESVSDRVEDAQQAFLVFQGALRDSPWLEPLGEPRKLVITAAKEDGGLIKKVEFNMEYNVAEMAPNTHEAPAVALREGD